MKKKVKYALSTIIATLKKNIWKIGISFYNVIIIIITIIILLRANIVKLIYSK